MVLHCLFAIRKETYPGENNVAELLEAITEYDYSDYPDHFDSAVRKAHNDEWFDHVGVVDIELFYPTVDKILRENPSLPNTNIRRSEVGNNGNG